MIQSELQLKAGSERKTERRLAITTIWVLRLVAVIHIVLAIWIWSRTVGFWPDASYRFDAIPVPSRVYHAVLCVLFPVTAVGLWTTLAWGRVVWFIAICVQLLAFAFYRDVIDVENQLLGFHAMAVAIYFALETGLRLVTNDE